MRVVYFAETIEKDKDGVSRVLYKLAELNKKNGVENNFNSWQYTFRTC